MKLAIRPLTPDVWPDLENLFWENGQATAVGADIGGSAAITQIGASKTARNSAESRESGGA